MWKASVSILCLASLAGTSGCSRQPDDVDIVKAVQTQIQKDGAISSDIKVESANGFVTLSGQVRSEGESASAAQDASGTAGVKGVFNHLTFDAPTEAATRKQRRTSVPRPQNADAIRASAQPQPASFAADTAAAAPAQPFLPVTAPAASITPPTAPTAPVPAPAPALAPQPPPPPAPVKHVISSGTVLSIRLIDALDSGRNKVGDTFRATLKVPLDVDGAEVIPAGADIEGRVVDVSNAGRFTGHSELNLELLKLTSGGTVYPVETASYDRADDGRGKGTAETVGAGAAIGAIIGAIAGGGKGAAVGTAAGAGAGGATRAAKSGKRIVYPSETVLTFKLQEPITVITTKGPAADMRATH